MVDPNVPEVVYSIEVETGSHDYAGTDSNIWISMTGEHSSKQDVLLKSSEGVDEFERGEKDKFTLKLPYLGAISEVSLRTDGTGEKSSWLLSKVTIRCKNYEGIEEKYEFPFGKWFSEQSGYEHSKEVQQKNEEKEENDFCVASVTLDGDYKDHHHTYKFQEDPKLVILRRGFTFKLKVSLLQPLKKDVDDFQIVLKIDSEVIIVPQVKNLQESISNNSSKWYYQIWDSSQRHAVAEVFIPANALVARYDLQVRKGSAIYEKPGKTVILFNPWCKDDEVYMKSTDDLREYVLRQHGHVYQGTAKKPYPKDWYFGQFELISLNTAFYLLEKGVANSSRDTAPEVARLISSKCNSFDNDGILEGNWTDDFSDGKGPSFWSTTPAILAKYQENLYQPVKYGQCWVFSAIVTTIMRSLGIPCRSVTNFSSAHDSNANCANDVYFDENDEVDTEMSDDSVWNFHVWNDVWMKRNDLSGLNGLDDCFDGWQAIDATPQEESEDLYQMGPAPLMAVKSGQVEVNFDTKFVFAEVNAETFYWSKDKDGKYTIPERISYYKVGEKISTKAVNKNRRDDITNEYKHREHSELERSSVRRALRLVDHPAVENKIETFKVDVEAGKDEYYAGESVEVNVKVRNLSKDDKPVRLSLKAKLVHYDGTPVRTLQTDGVSTRKIKVKGEEECSIIFTINASTYLSHLDGDDSIRIYATVRHLESRELAVANDVIDILKPVLEFTNIPDLVSTKDGMRMTVSFTNPLNIPLTRCEGAIGGTLLPFAVYDRKISDIPPNGTFKKTYENIEINKINSVITNFKKKKFFYTFWCYQLGGFNGVVRVNVSNE